MLVPVLKAACRARLGRVYPPSFVSLTYSAMAASFSQGSDKSGLAKALRPLLESSQGGRWTLGHNGEALERAFKFKTFAKAFEFMTAVSLQCKTHSHHPEWSNMYDTVFVRWSTHDKKGLSGLDVTLATLCDSIAKDVGEVEPTVEDTIKMKEYIAKFHLSVAQLQRQGSFIGRPQ